MFFPQDSAFLHPRAKNPSEPLHSGRHQYVLSDQWRSAQNLRRGEQPRRSQLQLEQQGEGEVGG